jgi:hypothetical protein
MLSAALPFSRDGALMQQGRSVQLSDPKAEMHDDF